MPGSTRLAMSWAITATTSYLRSPVWPIVAMTVPGDTTSPRPTRTSSTTPPIGAFTAEPTASSVRRRAMSACTVSISACFSRSRRASSSRFCATPASTSTFRASALATSSSVWSSWCWLFSTWVRLARPLASNCSSAITTCVSRAARTLPAAICWSIAACWRRAVSSVFSMSAECAAFRRARWSCRMAARAVTPLSCASSDACSTRAITAPAAT